MTATDEKFAQHIETIKSIFPDLDTTNAIVNKDGLTNDVILIDDRVFRFPKDDWARQSLHTEAQLLATIQPHISLKLPTVEHVSDAMFVCDRIVGEPLFRHDLMRMDADRRKNVLSQLGEFLTELHHIPLETITKNTDLKMPDSNPHKQAIEFYQTIQEKLFPLVMTHTRAIIDDIFRPIFVNPGFFRFETALIHDDLAQYHILFDQSASHIKGVIDFGVAHIGDPAKDIGLLISTYGESLIEQIADVYPDYSTLLPRARYYAKTLEIQWVLGGIRTNDLTWFAVHLDRARDIR